MYLYVNDMNFKLKFSLKFSENIPTGIACLLIDRHDSLNQLPCSLDNCPLNLAFPCNVPCRLSLMVFFRNKN